jgi:hypothetical protein
LRRLQQLGGVCIRLLLLLLEKQLQLDSAAQHCLEGAGSVRPKQLPTHLCEMQHPCNSTAHSNA